MPGCGRAIPIDQTEISCGNMIGPATSGVLSGSGRIPIMLKKIMPVLVLAAFVAGPAFAAGEKKQDCSKITDKAKKEACMAKQKK